MDIAFPVMPVRYVRFIANASKPGGNGYYYTVVSELEIYHSASLPGTLLAQWTASGDDGATGRADDYDLRISACPFSPGNGERYPTDTPRTAGESESSRIVGLERGTYCVAIEAIDEAGNRSGWSNVVEMFTPGNDVP